MHQKKKKTGRRRREKRAFLVDIFKAVAAIERARRQKRELPAQATKQRKNRSHSLTNTMAFALPDLPYEYTALEPHIDSTTMTIHHTKHHNTYVNNMNTVTGKVRPKGKQQTQQKDDISLSPSHPLALSISTSLFSPVFFFFFFFDQQQQQQQNKICQKINFLLLLLCCSFFLSFFLF